MLTLVKERGCSGRPANIKINLNNNCLARVKYERAMADLDFAKRRLLEQHEEDLEQTMVLKKQLEKKVRTIRILDTHKLHPSLLTALVTGWLWFVNRETREPQPLLDTEQLSKDDFS